MLARLLIILLTLPVAFSASAHGEKAHDAPAIDYSRAEQHPFGRAADPARARRVVRVDMGDEMRFSPAEISVRKGDTVRFEIRNTGKLVHEMVLGTMVELRAHADMMAKHPGMEHDAPYMVHVAPGKSGKMGWQFTQEGEFYYGCLVAGHFEAGMLGKVKVIP